MLDETFASRILCIQNSRGWSCKGIAGEELGVITFETKNS